MKNKVVLITGGATGIGKAIVEEFAKNKYDIILVYNSSEKSAEDIVLKHSKNGIKIVAEKCDISNEENIHNMLKNVYKNFKNIDVLVNNAGVCYDTLFMDKTIEQFKNTLNVNIIGTFLLSRNIGQKMYDNKYGKIINISSTNGINTYFPMCVDYDVSKAGINSLTHNLAVQFSPYVNVNAVAPGFIGTENELKDMDCEFIESEQEKILVKRIGTVQDVANLVFFLADDKSSFINNQIIKIDGGIYGDC